MAALAKSKSRQPEESGVETRAAKSARFFLATSLRAARGVGRNRAIHVEMKAVSSINCGIAISVFGVASTMARRLFVAWRTDELPDMRVGDPALGRWRWILRRATAWRGWAGIVVDPVDQLSGLDLLANEIRRDEAEPLALINGNGRTVDAGPKAKALKFGSPDFQIGSVG